MTDISRKMLRIFYFNLILYTQFSLYEANPSIGKNVRKAEGNDLTFVVSISLNNSMETMEEKYAHICGGSLITRQHVLTAAHCFNNETRNYTDIVVKVGSFDLKSAKIYEAKWVVTYEEWSENEIPDEYRGENTHDIAILKLVKKVSCGIRLPKLTNTPDAQLYGAGATTAGWGLMEKDKRPRYLRVAKLIVLTVKECLFVSHEEDLDIKDFFSKIYLCTKADPPIILGCGDSGGPLIINEREIIGVNVGICATHNAVKSTEYQNKHLSINYHRQFIYYVKNL